MSIKTVAASKELNFVNKREQAVSASSARLDVPANNGSSFTPGQTIDIRLPSGMTRGSYMDFENSYVKMKIQAKRGGTGTTFDLHLPRNGVHNVISKVEIMSSTSTISVIESYNKLCNIFLDSESSQAYKEGLGNAQLGTGGGTATTGIPLTSTTADELVSTTFCLGLILTPLWSSSKYLPLFHQDNLIIRLTLANFEDAFVGGSAATQALCAPVVGPVSMICNVVNLDASAQSAIDESNGGLYQMVLDDWRNSAGGAIQTTQRLINQNLGFSNQSLSRVIFAFYLASTTTTDSNGARPSRHVSEYTFMLNGRAYPASKIKASTISTDINVSEAVAEIRASTRQSGDFQQGGDIDEGQFISDTETGRAFYEIDLESLRSETDAIYSGLYTVGGSTSLECSMNLDGAAVENLQVWGQYQGALTLDTTTNNVFTYSV